MTVNIPSVNLYASKKPVEAAKPVDDGNFIVKIPHPREEELVGILQSLASGVEDVAGKAKEALDLLQNDGIYASFSKYRPGDEKKPWRNQETGEPELRSNQVLIWGHKPFDPRYSRNDVHVLYTGWGQNSGFTKEFMANVNAMFDAAKGGTPVTATAPAMIPAGAPVEDPTRGGTIVKIG